MHFYNVRIVNLVIIVNICCQFHQHFTREFFIQKCFAQHFGFEIFWRKNIGAKGAHKMLMKLTPSPLTKIVADLA